MARFDALLRFTSLGLGRRLGTEVVPVLSRKELSDPSLRAQALTQSLATTGQMVGAVRIPDTVGHLVITADLRAGRVTCHVDIDAPRTGRSATRVNWLVRQLKNAPGSVRLESFVAHGRGSSTAELLSKVRDDPTALVGDPSKEIRTFRVAASTTMGTKRTRGRGSFIESVLGAVDGFYEEVLGGLKAWSAAPPKLRHATPETGQEVETTRPASLSSNDYSSQDGPEFVARSEVSAQTHVDDEPLSESAPPSHADPQPSIPSDIDGAPATQV